MVYGFQLVERRSEMEMTWGEAQAKALEMFATQPAVLDCITGKRTVTSMVKGNFRAYERMIDGLLDADIPVMELRGQEGKRLVWGTWAIFMGHEVATVIEALTMAKAPKEETDLAKGLADSLADGGEPANDIKKAQMEHAIGKLVSGAMNFYRDRGYEWVW